MKAKTFFSYMAIVILFLHCEKDKSVNLNYYKSDNPTSVIKYLMPLKVNNEWIYTDSTSSGTNESILKITGNQSVKYNNEEYQVYYWDWVHGLNQNPPNDRYLLRNEEDGVWSMGGISTSDTLITRICSFKYPVGKDDTWSSKQVYIGSNGFFLGNEFTVKCLSINETITTPAGDFECYVYNFIDDTFSEDGVSDEYTYYYTPDLGMVCMIFKSNNQIQLIKKLKSYSLNK